MTTAAGRSRQAVADRRAGAALPLTAGQRGLWFLHMLAPGDTAYNTCTAIELTGPLSLAALRTAIGEVGRRHDTLRTVFAGAQAEPVQVLAARPPALRLVDLTRLPEAAREEAARGQLGRLAALPFDLSGGGYPARWVVLRLGPRRHVLVLDAHHIVFDRESLGVVCAELEDCYSATVAGTPAAAGPAGPPSDAQLVAAAWTAPGGQAASLRFWRSSLDGAPRDSTPLTLFASGQPGSPGIVRETIRLDHDDLWDLAAVCRSESATTFVAVASLLAVLVGRYTGQRDVVIGAPVSLRGRDQERAVGLLINTLPLRVRLGPRSSLRGVVRQVRDTVLDALEHRQVPLHRIVEELGASRDAGASPLFQVLISYQLEARPPRLPGVRAVPAQVPAAAAKYGLTVTVTQLPSGLEVLLETDRRLCRREDLAAYGRHLVALARGASADPDAPLDAIDLLDRAERADARDAARGRPAARPPAGGIHDLVRASAAARPDAIALLAPGAPGDGWHLSYAALIRCAGRLARALRAAGARSDGPVGVLQRRGPGLPISYLAAQLAGGAVLPLEPDDPDDRLAKLIADSGTRLVVTHRQLAGRCARLGVAVVVVEDFLGPGGRPGAVPEPAPPARPAHPDQAAYVLYTSGSTGEPKGVVVPHRGLVNRVQWISEAIGLRPGERVLAKTPLAFDVSMPEIYWPLAAGATLCLSRSGGERDPQYLADVIAREQIGVTHFIPSMLAPFLAEIEARGQRLPALRVVECSGEALSAELCQRAAAVLDADLYNLYGPTEASVEVTAWRYDPAHSGPIPIGAPIANVDCRVLDERLRFLPGPAVGELYLGGLSPARGYLGRPGLTAAAFVPAPAAGPGDRCYRTGDLARRGPDGLLYLVGRRDDQVKIAGRRIEPGEVAEVLRHQPGVIDAAVVVGRDRLAAFVVLQAGAADGPWLEHLLGGLRTELPGYLVPGTIEALAALPATAAGKVDVRALRERAERTAPRASGGVAPRTDLERRLAAIWSDVLQVGPVGAHDRFFDLGGTSLSLLRLHRELADTVAPGLLVADLFRFPTVATLSRFLADGAPAAPSTVPAAVLARASRRRAAAGRPPGERP
jgi:amino acid adenylation domain-containing protein